MASQDPYDIAVLSVVSNLMKSELTFTRVADFWKLASEDVRKHHGIEIPSSRVEKMYIKMRRADATLPDARKSIRQAIRRTLRRNRAAEGAAGPSETEPAEEGEEEGEEETEEKLFETELPFRGREEKKLDEFELPLRGR